MVSNIIQPGNQVDLCMLQQIEMERKTGVRAHIYKSQVIGILSDGELELSMPTEAERPVMLPIGIRFEFVFYSKDGLYRGLGLVEERYKSDNRYMLRVSLKSQLRKYQRREFSRVPCAIGMAYYGITPEQALGVPPGQLQQLKELPQVLGTRREASIVDISGGGARFVSDAESRNGSYILMEVRLDSADDAAAYLFPAHILASLVSGEGKGRFETRVEFVIRDRKVREEIIRYIFDEERKNRNK